MLAVPREVSGVAMAATRALIRRGVKRLHLVALPTSSLQADLLIGAGCVESIETSATLTMEKLEAGFTITAIHLDVVARIPGGDAAKFEEAANNAKAGCPVSRVLNAKITMNAKLA